MPWLITKDLIGDASAPQPSNLNAVGMVGPLKSHRPIATSSGCA